MFRINKILQLVIAACLLISSTTAIAQTWVPLNGPQIATNVKDISLSGNFVYIAEQDYLLKSTNGGTAWKGTTSNFTTPSVVLCKPDNSNIVIASRQNFFKFSTDGGATWGNVTPSTIIDYLTPLRLSASPVNTSNIFLGRKYDVSTKSIWRSLNEGALWEPCNNFTWATDVYDVAPYPVAGVGRDAELWVCGSNPSGQLKYPPRSISAVSSISGIWYSTNSGTDWQAKAMGDFNITSIAVAHKSTPYLYAGTSDGEIYRSVNYGVDWAFSKSIGYSIRMIRVNQTNGYVFAATENGIQRSINDGADWYEMNNGLSDRNVQSITIQPNSIDIYAGTATSIYKSTDNGATWVNMGMMKTNSVDANEAGNIFAVTNDNSYVGKYQSNYWSNKYLSSAGANFNSNHIYRDIMQANYYDVTGALNNLPSIFLSTDGGENFQAATIPTITAGKFNGTVRRYGSGADLYLYGGATVSGLGWKDLFKSTDMGVTWNPLSFTVGGENIYINDFAPTTTQILIAALSDGRIMRSGDNGQYWTNPYSVGSIAKSIAWNQSYTNVIYVAGSGGLYKSINSGSNWVIKRSGDIKK